MGAVTADVYPTRVLAGSETALILFAAAFGGRQDAHHIAEAGLRATCVDIDAARLRKMEAVYPANWDFVAADVFEFVDRTPERSYDVVSADPFTNLFDACAAIAADLCLIARHTVVVGAGRDTILDVPYGWRETGRVKRSDYESGVYWAVLERG